MGWVFRIIVLCLIVGLLLSFLSIDPVGMLNDTWRTILSIGALLGGVIDWALPYILLGAVVVVPIAVVAAVLRLLRHRS
jgi:hypothetical protein